MYCSPILLTAVGEITPSVMELTEGLTGMFLAVGTELYKYSVQRY